MTNWNTIDELREIFIQKYIHSALQSELEKACSEEYELKRDYNGRQILELLQNVDDANEELKSDIHIVVNISFKDNILEVGNTGTTFTAETIERLCLGRASEKTSQKIGNKGTGFRSLLNDAEWIEIHSGDYSVRFSEKYAQELFAKYRDEPLIAAQLKNWKKDYDFCFPIMNCPESIVGIAKDVDTLIRVKVKSENENKETGIKKQLKQPFYKSILFLPNITKIVIKTDSIIKEYTKIIDGNKVHIEEKLNSKIIHKPEEYFVYSDRTPINKQEADLIIAIPKDENYDFSNEKMYCYFPIRNFKTPIHALIHAPFSTNNSRDDVPDDSEEINKKIFIVILKLVKTIAEKLADRNLYIMAIKMIIPLMDSKLWKEDFFNLKNTYFTLLSTAKIFPTVNHNLISINDHPKILDFMFPKEFYGIEFEKLLVYLDNDCNQFVKDLAEFINYPELAYSEKELSVKINNITAQADIKTRVELFLFWNKYFKSNTHLPKLLQDTNESWIVLNSRIYLPTDGGVSVLPKELAWVKLCILKQEYVTELITQIKKTRSADWKTASENSQSGGDKRTLAAFSRSHFSIDFIEQSSHELIISTINQQIKTIDESRSFINWLFNNYGKDLKKGSELSKVKFRLPNRNNNICPIDELYLGKDYSNPIAEKLFQNTKITPLASLNTIYAGSEKKEFIAFLKKCNILEYPRIIPKSLIDKVKFKNFVAQRYITGININYLNSKTIDNIENLIQTLDTKEIKTWIANDEELKNLILSKEMSSDANQNSAWYPRYFLSNAYIKFILNTTPWIELGGKKYPPCNIIKSEKIKNNIDGYYGISERELIQYLGKDIVQNLDLDFKDSIAQLPDKDIKIFLDKLPNFDSGKISRELYLDIIKFKQDQKPTYSTSNLKLLCKDGKFHLNTEIKYADRRISKAEKKSGRFIHIPTKQSTKTIKDWLGVERYKTSLKLKNFSLLNARSEFNLEINDIKIALLCIIDTNKKNVDSLKRIEIIPCTEIEVLDLEQENKIISLEDYFFVEKENNFYIKIPRDISMSNIRQIDTFALSVIEIFKQALTLSLENESSLIELLISKDTKSKKIKIDDLYGIDKWNSVYELLYNRNFTNEQCCQFFKENRLKIDLLNKISKIDFTSELSQFEYETLIRALKEVSKDIVDLNQYSESINISLIPFFEIEMKKLMNSEFEKYRLNVYQKTKFIPNDYALFLDKLEAYKNFDTVNFKFKNSVLTDLNNILLDKFTELKIETRLNLNPDDIYNANVKNIISNSSFSNDDFDYFIQNHKETRAILYFEIPSELCTDIKNFLLKNTIKDSRTSYSVQDEIRSSTVQTKLKEVKTSQHEPRIQGRTEKSKKDYENNHIQAEHAGKSAEEIAFNELRKTYKNLIWHSKYSNNPADRNNPPPNGIVCDMWNFDSKNGNLYFEVKSATTEFEMTLNEYESMKRNKNNFEVVLVNRDTQEISRHTFQELEAFKQVNGYKFRFEQKKIL